MGRYALEYENMKNMQTVLSGLRSDIYGTMMNVNACKLLLSAASGDVAEALMSRINTLYNRIAQERRNIDALYEFNKDVTAYTAQAESCAVLRMKGISSGILDYVKQIAKGLGDLSDINVADDITDFINHVKDKYKEISEAVMDKTSFKVDTGAEYTYKDGSYEYDDGVYHVDGNYELLHAEAQAGASGGVFTYDENGNLVFNPHMEAYAKAGVTLLSAGGAVGVGDSMLGAGASGNVTVGQVSGELGGSVGVFDKDGNLNPHVNLSAEARAILVSADAEAHVSVAGVEAKVKGEVEVGLDAHAKVDIGDGRVAVDVGAAIGIGGSVSFEIDYSGAVEAVKGVTKGAKKFFEHAKSWIGW